MNKILKSVAVIAFVGAIAVGATSAYFSDTATITGNTFAAGTMDLKIDQNVDSGTQDWVDGFDISNDDAKNLSFRTSNGWTGEEYHEFTNFLAQSGLQNLKPGDVREQIIDIKSVGTVDGIATIDLNRTSAWSDLAGVLNFHVLFNGDNNGTSEWAETVLNGTVDDYTQAYDLGAIGPSGIASVKIIWTVPTTAGNEIMGDIVEINTVFGLRQVQ